MLRDIPGPSGRLEALLDEPVARPSQLGIVEADDPPRVRAAVVFGHPHPQLGGTMHTKTVYQSAKALTRIGCAVLRFNFRGAGTSAGVFDDGPGEMDDFRAALDFMHARYPHTPLWSAGMSFGAWIGLSVGAQDARVSALLGLSAPVCKYDFSAVAASPTPKFFIHGEFDEVCSLNDVRRFYAHAAEPKELIVIGTSDHLFDGRLTEVTETIEDLLGDWSS